ncbi:cell division protein FtsK [Actinomadura graeca]|uniref:Cell division protein FtsK n=1 Tax=Actinomadura graeca TaxID=2750812 RepID=A0ABX8R549_9ACTN|nr:hypothetical protein [Actinomadura graeca]QXJ25968.1 cell division protein FtsK [Actinomadura graeca]
MESSEEREPPAVDLVKHATELLRCSDDEIQIAEPEDLDVLEGRVVDAPLGPVAAVRGMLAEAAGHRYTQTAVRQVLYVAGGVLVLIRRVWDSRTTARYERMLRAAEAGGDQQATLEWEARAAAFRRDRHDRRMDLLNVPLQIVSALPKLAAGAAVLLIGPGILVAVANDDPRQITAPVQGLAHLVQFLIVVAGAIWVPVLLATPCAMAAALWSLGRTRAHTPGWLVSAADADVDLTIDETTIARALEALRIPQITAHFKQGLPLQYLTPARRDGRGTHAIVRLPPGVTAERIARRRADLATGLHRLAKEVWPTTGSEAGIVDLWIADKGVLTEGAGPYPPLEEGATDLFKGVPFGRTLRGDPITAPIMDSNTITGGMPGQGKSSATRAIMAGVALDPAAELRIWVPDTNYDFDAFQPRCSRFVRGDDAAHIAQIRDDLLELSEDVQRRGDLLVQYEVTAVTRALADAGIGLHPLVCLLEEAHVAFQHPRYGEEISGLYIDIVKLGRKRGIHMITSTQAPTKDSMPRAITRNCSVGIAFAVGDHYANDALLGQGAYASGHRATELIPGIDRGTAVVKGFTGQRSQIVQVYFLSADKSNDQVTPIIERSLAEIERGGRAVPGTDRFRPGRHAQDLLADLDRVLGAERIRLADVTVLLRELAPAYGPYLTLTGVQLRDWLTQLGVRVTNTGNVLRLDPAEVRHALAKRDIPAPGHDQ